MKIKPIVWAAIVAAFIFTSLSSQAAVTHWRVVKGAYYLQSADDTPDATTTNWGIFGIVEMELPGDAASVVITGGNIAGSVAYDLAGSEWELGVDYASKATLDAVFPSDASYSIILSGGTMGSVTQQFSFAADAYPNIPYLTGADYSDGLALEALEPFELNWNDSGISGGAIGLQINTGAELDEGDTILELLEWNGIASTNLPWNLFVANSNYNGYIDFANADLQSGAGGFGIDGDVSFNTSLAFHIDTVNTAVESDDFNGGTNSAWISFLSEAGKGYTPTNDVLEFTSDAGPDVDSTAWIYDTAALSYTQDWSVAVDLANFMEPSSLSGSQELYFGIIAATEDLNYLFSVETFVDAFVKELFCGADSNGVEEVIEISVPLSTSRASVKISFDADTKLLTSSYSTGGDFMVITNFPASDWGMADTNEFITALYCGTDALAITSGTVFAENFRIHDGKVLSNEVESVDLEFLHSYGDGLIYLPDNFVKAESDSSLRITSMDVTTASGWQFNVPSDGVENDTQFWDVEIPLGFSTSWDPADDGDWIVTYGFNDGTFQSVVVPFTKEDGTAPMPNFFYMPEFLPPSPANNSSITNNSFNLAWTAAGPNANHISVEEITPENETGDIELLFADALPGDTANILDLTFSGPLSTTNHGPVVLGDDLRRMRIVEGYGRAAYSGEGIPYVVSKICESDIIFTITDDIDGDNMDDSWEIQFFGSTNAVNGGPLDNWDGDALNNLEEFIAGVDPTSGGSVFGVEQAEPVPAGFVVNWTAVEGRVYGVYWTDDLASGFQTLATGLAYPQNSYTDTVHTVEDGGFYYIDVQLAE